MQQKNFLILVGESRLSEASAQFLAIGAKPVANAEHIVSFDLEHRVLKNLAISINIITHIDAIFPFLRKHPVDLIIYDERGNNQDAITAVKKIAKSSNQLALRLGTDYYFPLSRIVCILHADRGTQEKIFLLGRENISEILVDPKDLNHIIFMFARRILSKEKGAQKIAAAFSGGAMLGFFYQVGVVCALEAAFENYSFQNIDILTGISSGSIISAALAAKITTKDLLDLTRGTSAHVPRLRISEIYDLAVKDILNRLLKQSLRRKLLDPIRWPEAVNELIPTGLFKGEGIRRIVVDILSMMQLNDSFQSLPIDLYIGVTNQDTFELKVFGPDDICKTKVSDVVRASSALPPIFTPVRIGSELYSDGQITKSCLVELPIKKSCKLVFVIDPMVPLTFRESGSIEKRGGLFNMTQTVKAVIQSRFRSTISNAQENFPECDILVFQPEHESAHAMAGIPMGFSLNSKIIGLAYQDTLKKIRSRYSFYQAVLAKHNIELAAERKLKSLQHSEL